MDSQAVVLPGQAEPPLVLALDIGTSSVRALLFDRQGRVVGDCLARQPVELYTSSDGAAVIDPDRLLESIWVCIDLALEQAGPLGQHIAGVGACTFVSNILGVDQAGRAVSPIYTYADTRAAEDASILRQRLDETAAHQRVGCLFHPSYLPARFLWLARTQPEILQAARRWMSIGEYMALNLFGGTAASYSGASWTGLLDRRHLEWDHELLELLPITPGQLSSLVDVDFAWQGLGEPYASRWPALKNALWFPAVGDGAAANLGSGCVSPRQMAVTMGTTTALRVVIPGEVPFIPKGLWCYRVDRLHSLLGGALSEGGNIFAWLHDTLRLEGIPDLEAALAALPPDTHGLTFLPLLAGERSPGWVGEARGVIAGLSLATSPLEILRAGLEGVACRIGLIDQLLQSTLPAAPVGIASGGALLNSPALLQIVTDVLGRPVSLSGSPEASARGAAMLVLRSLGAVPSLEDFPGFTGRVVEPNIQNHEQYQKSIQRQQALYQKTIMDSGKMG